MLAGSGLTLDIVFVLGILIFTMLLFISDVVRVDVVALIVLGLLGLSNLLPPEQLFSGFSSEAVISLISIMIISKGLDKSGVTERLAKWLLALGKAHNQRISSLLMIISGVLASFMRAFGTVAIFLPVAANETKKAPARNKAR